MIDRSNADVAWDSIVAEAYVGKAWDERKSNYVHAVVLNGLNKGKLNMEKWNVLCRKIKEDSMAGFIENDYRQSKKCPTCEARIIKNNLTVYEYEADKK